MNIHVDTLLNLPNVTVEICRNVEDYVYIELCCLNPGIPCPYCHKYTEEIHQNRPILIRDLPISGKATYLKIPRRQFYCQHCGHYSTENLEFVGSHRRHTKRYEQNIYQRVATSNITQVAREENLKYDEVKGMFDNHCKKVEKKTGLG
ncbi:MAG: transposase family protein [Moorea sp. SIO2I5]|nr:transposase family protein [Moorena sp. SIO2I5]